HHAGHARGRGSRPRAACPRQAAAARPLALRTRTAVARLRALLHPAQFAEVGARSLAGGDSAAHRPSWRSAQPVPHPGARRRPCEGAADGGVLRDARLRAATSPARPGARSRARAPARDGAPGAREVRHPHRRPARHPVSRRRVRPGQALAGPPLCLARRPGRRRMAARHPAHAGIGEGAAPGDRDRGAQRSGHPQPGGRDLARRGPRPHFPGAGRGLERFRPDARYRRLRPSPGGRLRVLRPQAYAAALAPGADRMAASRMQPLLRARLPAWAYQLLEPHRAGPGPGVAAARDAFRDRAPAATLKACRRLPRRDAVLDPSTPGLHWGHRMPGGPKMMSKPKFATPAAVEEAFYDAMARGDLHGLMSLWADDDEIVCIHPGGPRTTGVPAVRRAWASVLAEQLDIRARSIRD